MSSAVGTRLILLVDDGPEPTPILREAVNEVSRRRNIAPPPFGVCLALPDVEL
jgi:hypothetical protein